MPEGGDGRFRLENVQARVEHAVRHDGVVRTPIRGKRLFDHEPLGGPDLRLRVQARGYSAALRKVEEREVQRGWCERGVPLLTAGQLGLADAYGRDPLDLHEANLTGLLPPSRCRRVGCPLWHAFERLVDVRGIEQVANRLFEDRGASSRGRRAAARASPGSAAGQRARAPRLRPGSVPRTPACYRPQARRLLARRGPRAGAGRTLP